MSEELDLKLRDFYSLEDRYGGNEKVTITLSSLRKELAVSARQTAMTRCKKFCKTYKGTDDEKDENHVRSTNPDEERDEESVTSTEPNNEEDEGYVPSIESDDEQNEDHVPANEPDNEEDENYVSSIEFDDKSDEDYMPCSERDLEKVKQSCSVVISSRKL